MKIATVFTTRIVSYWSRSANEKIRSIKYIIFFEAAADQTVWECIQSILFRVDKIKARTENTIENPVAGHCRTLTSAILSSLHCTTCTYSTHHQKHSTATMHPRRATTWPQLRAIRFAEALRAQVTASWPAANHRMPTVSTHSSPGYFMLRDA